jgi:hypothetical protein
VSLGDQLERALVSVPLHLAEGAYARGKNRQVRYHSAAASAWEALACLETAEALGWLGPLEPEPGAWFQQVIGALVRLSNRGAEQFSQRVACHRRNGSVR